MGKSKGEKRVGEERLNSQGCLMRLVEYDDALNVIVQFQDEYKSKINTQYNNFINGYVKNPYYPDVLGVGMVGIKYKVKTNDKHTKEYYAWRNMLDRCFDEKTKEKYLTYKEVICCKEWLLYESFYEWLHSQKNFGNWYKNDDWHLDKDILKKGNKIYSPESCCLVPNNVNKLFIKQELHRGELPIGVTAYKDEFIARCNNPITGNREYLGSYSTPSYAFFAYKKYKEELIKQIAQIEYDKGNITKKCYNAMLNYEVEITD